MTARQAMQDDLDTVFFDGDDAYTDKAVHVSGVTGVRTEVIVYAYDSEDEYEFSEHPFTEVWVRSADLPALAKKDTLVIKGKDMSIVDFQPDEFGDITKIFLNGEMV